MQLNKVCLEQIRRVMRQRAISVDLIPEIEEVCLKYLSDLCFDKTKKGEEMQCLQKNLDVLQGECRQAVSKLTEIEVGNVELNPYIMKNCYKILELHCRTEMRGDEGDAMECLIAHKNYPDVKANAACRISIEHFQIISLKDITFSYKFKVACKPYAERFCSLAKTKAKVVACLSERVTNDTINGIRSSIQKDCKQQLRAQLFQLRENIEFDVDLKEACNEDIKNHCKDVEHGSARVSISCIIENVLFQLNVLKFSTLQLSYSYPSSFDLKFQGVDFPVSSSYGVPACYSADPFFSYGPAVRVLTTNKLIHP